MQRCVLLSIIVPVRDEERLVAAAVAANIEAASALDVPFEVIVVDDGSRDRTAAIVRGLDVPMVSHARGMGLGAAVHSGMQASRGTFCIVAPADNPHSADTLRRFLEAARDADLVLGFRPRRVGYSLLMRFNSWLYHGLLRWFCRLGFRDVNWIHMYRRDRFVDVPVRSQGVAAAAEIVLQARARGYRIREVECPMRPRLHGTPSASRLSVMVRAGLSLLALLWRFRAVRR